MEPLTGIMPNQYSITLSDTSARILNDLKERGWKISHAIDVAVRFGGCDFWYNLPLAFRQNAPTWRDQLGVDEE